MINSAGFKIYPAQVEQMMQTIPGVLETAVFGIPDEVRGESVNAWVILEPGATWNATTLRDHCRSKMAAYKVPHNIRIVQELPKTATGKIKIAALKKTAPLAQFPAEKQREVARV
jgi:long-chain acyl-CoA synthetase